MADETEPRSARFAGFAMVAKMIGWIGASTGALTLFCTVFGFLVKQTVLERLGVSRSVFEPTSTEYVASGAKFLASLVPLAAFGAVEFFVAFWWAAASLVVFVLALLVVRRWRWKAELRLFGITALYAVWLVAMLLRLTERPARDSQGLDVFIFVTLAGVIYCYVEAWFAGSGSGAGAVLSWGARLPLYALMFCSVLALPYVKGLHGTIPTYPLIEFLGKDRDAFCALVAKSTSEEKPNADCAVFELIEQGSNRVLLRKPPKSKIYVVPVAEMNTFSLLPLEESR
jgi:hypothetical protein